jgi:hypothetical protein
MRDRIAAGSLAFTLLALPGIAPQGAAGPPERPSARMVLDKALELRARVRQLEEENARAKPDPDLPRGLAEQIGEARAERLAQARAELAEMEGRYPAAGAEWRKVIALRNKWLEWMLSPLACCGNAEIAMYRGYLAEARWRLAEAEKDWPAIEAELPKVILGYKQEMEFLRELRKFQAIDEGDTAEREVAEKLRAAQSRLEHLKKKPHSP